MMMMIERFCFVTVCCCLFASSLVEGAATSASSNDVTVEGLNGGGNGGACTNAKGGVSPAAPFPASSFSAAKDFAGHQLIRVHVDSPGLVADLVEYASALRQRSSAADAATVTAAPVHVLRRGPPTDLVVAPSAVQDVLEYLYSSGMQNEVLADDFASVFVAAGQQRSSINAAANAQNVENDEEGETKKREEEEERRKHEGAASSANNITKPATAPAPAPPAAFDLTRYHTHEEINAYLRRLPELFPGKVRVGSIGRSFEQREMLYVQIGYPQVADLSDEDNSGSSSVSSDEAGQRRRAMQLQRANNDEITEEGLLLEKNADKEAAAAKKEGGRKRVVRRFEVPKPAMWVDAGIHAREWIAPATALNFIFQLLNNTQHDGMLRAIDVYVLPSLNPDGYEYSRNVDPWWRRTRSCQANSSCVGVDGNRNFAYRHEITNQNDTECGETYSGPNAFSEPETKNLVDFLSPRTEQFSAYLTLHSYGNMILCPYTDADKQQMAKVAKKMRQSIKEANGPFFDVYLLNAAGTGFTYMKQMGIKYAYLMELTDGRAGGFWHPEYLIGEVGEQIVPGMVALAKVVAEEAEKSGYEISTEKVSFARRRHTTNAAVGAGARKRHQQVVVKQQQQQQN